MESSRIGRRDRRRAPSCLLMLAVTAVSLLQTAGAFLAPSSPLLPRPTRSSVSSIDQWRRSLSAPGAGGAAGAGAGAAGGSSRGLATMLAAQKPPSEGPGGSKTQTKAKGAAATEVGIFHPEHPYRDAFVKTGFSVGAALLFGLGVWYFKGADSGLEYYSGYLVEQSLSVDNLFVFVVLFEYFKVPADYQGRVLSWGIFGAMAMRALMVFAGVEAIENFKAVLLGFAAILVFTSAKLLLEDGGDAEEKEDLTDNAIVKVARSMITTVDYYDGPNFFTNVDGARVATPLLLVLICVELSDVVFAVDSVPAVFGVTKDPFVVYTSNIFAILGLRSLYTVLANAVVDLPYLKPAVALILGLVGGKLGLEYFGYEISNGLSLTVITSLLGAGVGASLYYRPNPDQ